MNKYPIIIVWVWLHHCNYGLTICVRSSEFIWRRAQKMMSFSKRAHSFVHSICDTFQRVQPFAHRLTSFIAHFMCKRWPFTLIWKNDDKMAFICDTKNRVIYCVRFFSNSSTLGFSMENNNDVECQSLIEYYIHFHTGILFHSSCVRYAASDYETNL